MHEGQQLIRDRHDGLAFLVVQVSEQAKPMRNRSPASFRLLRPASRNGASTLMAYPNCNGWKNYQDLADWAHCIVDTRNAMAPVKGASGKVWKA
jgi:hypothetical protein